MTIYVKESAAVKDYGFDWSDWLATAETIDTSTWSVDTGITKGTDSHDTTSTKVWLSGGTAGNSYQAVNTVVTSGGRTDTRSHTIKVLDSLVATPGSASANSYATLAEMKAYLSTRLHNSTAVDAATDDTLNRALITATRLLDEQIEWDEDTWPTAYETQALLWPRAGTYDLRGDEIDDNVIPQKLKDACCELAIYQIDADLTAADDREGLNGLTVGSIDIRFNSSNPKRRKVIPDAVMEMLADWGERKYGSRSSVDLRRV
jgi:hypothetical protein